jgi:putative membrane protein
MNALNRRVELMKRWTQLALAAGLALSVSACSGDRAPEADQNAPAARDGAAGSTGTTGTTALSNGDAEFVREQLAMGTAEVELGKLAQERGTHPDVKNYGQMMVTDHRMAGEELKEIANRTNVKRGEGASDANKDAHGDHMEVREELAKLSGREFDRDYIARMIDDHEKGIDDVEAKAERAENPQVREWAAKTLPKMRNHLAKAKAIQDTLKNAEARKN